MLRLFTLLSFPDASSACFSSRNAVSQRRLQLGGHEAVVGVGLLELAFGQSRLVAEPFELLPSRPVDLLALLGERGHDPVVDVQLRGGQRLEEEADDVVVDRVAGDRWQTGTWLCCRSELHRYWVPPLYCTTILWPHSPQWTRPCSRAFPGRGTPRVLFRSYSLWLSRIMAWIFS